MALSPENEKARRLALESIEKLQEFVAGIDRDEREFPEPPPGADRFTIQVKFGRSEKTYTYLLLRSGGDWYSTGGTQFKSWDAVVRWLHGPRIVWHSPLYALQIPARAKPLLPSWGIE